MEIAYWIVAGLLAAFYLYSGGVKMAQSQEKLAPMMGWAGTAVPMAGVRACWSSRCWPPGSTCPGARPRTSGSTWCFSRWPRPRPGW